MRTLPNCRCIVEDIRDRWICEAAEDVGITSSLLDDDEAPKGGVEEPELDIPCSLTGPTCSSGTDGAFSIAGAAVAWLVSVSICVLVVPMFRNFFIDALNMHGQVSNIFTFAVFHIFPKYPCRLLIRHRHRFEQPFDSIGIENVESGNATSQSSEG